MAEQPIRLGIIGAGGIVKDRHLPGLRSLDGVEVVCVSNRRRANAEAVAKQWEIPEVLDTPEEVINRPDLDAVLIGTTPYMHRDLSIAALEAGKHVFCQARMARNLAEARDMQAAAAKHPKLVTMICPAPHAFPLGQYVRQEMAAGNLGDLRLVRLHHLNAASISAEAPMHWRMDKEVSGYNVLTLGIYAEILGQWVGPAKSVLAHGRIFTQQRKDPETGALVEVGVPESLVVTGELQNGAQFNYTFSAVAPYARGDWAEFYGTQGGLVYELNTDSVKIGVRPRSNRVDNQRISQGRIGRDDALTPVEVPEALQGGWSVEADFVSAIRNGTPVFPTFADGVAYMEFVEAVGRSLEQGKRIDLPLA